MGACSACDGLGVAQFFDPDKVVLHPELSLAAGAIRGWDRRNAYYFQLIASLAKHYKFNLDVPFEELAEPVREFTIASTLQKMLKGVTAVGNDLEWLPMSAAGVSLVIDEVTISGV